MDSVLRATFLPILLGAGILVKEIEDGEGTWKTASGFKPLKASPIAKMLIKIEKDLLFDLSMEGGDLTRGLKTRREVWSRIPVLTRMSCFLFTQCH